MRAALILAMCFVNRTARADQCVNVSSAQAARAKEVLPIGAHFVRYCAPCDDSSVGPEETIESLDLVDASNDSFNLRVNGAAVDLAYVYLERADGTARSLASLAKCPAEGVPVELRIAPAQAPSTTPIGVWSNAKATLNFSASGYVDISVEGRTTRARYTVNGDQLEIKAGEGRAETTTMLRLEVSADTLTTTASNGNTQTFRRIETNTRTNGEVAKRYRVTLEAVQIGLKADGRFWDGEGTVPAQDLAKFRDAALKYGTAHATNTIALGASLATIVASIALSVGQQPDPYGTAALYVDGKAVKNTQLPKVRDSYVAHWAGVSWDVSLDTDVRIKLELTDKDVLHDDFIGSVILTTEDIRAALQNGHVYPIPVTDQTNNQIISVSLSVLPE
ncbi:MAG: hypothetical protein QM831_31605 [Kofleriaceae bacterium]